MCICIIAFLSICLLTGTGMTQRDGMGREVGGGFRMGNTCKSMADSCQYMAKTTTIFKVISLQLIKINEKKNKRTVLLKL